MIIITTKVTTNTKSQQFLLFCKKKQTTKPITTPKLQQYPWFIQILFSFSPFTTGFAFLISSLPIPLKSNPQPCCSGYLWVPHNVNPHRHLNPVSPTRRLHVPHLFGWTFGGSASEGPAAAATNSTVGVDEETIITDGEDEDGWIIPVSREEELDCWGINVWFKTNFADEERCSFICKSR